MWTLITTAWNKAKYLIIGGGLAILYLLGYQKGKHKEQVKTMKGTLENVQKAKTIRDNVVDIDRIRRLHDKYKRWFLPDLRADLCGLWAWYPRNDPSNRPKQPRLWWNLYKNVAKSRFLFDFSIKNRKNLNEV